MRKIVLLSLAALPLAAWAQFTKDAKPVPPDLKRGFDSVNVNDGKKFLAYLAGPECEGRGTGEPGYEKAAQYMASNFKRFGLKPVMPDGSFFQYNDFWRTRPDAKAMEVTIGTQKLATKDINYTSNGKSEVSASAVLVAVPKSDSALTELLPTLKGKIVFLINPSGARGVERNITRAEIAGLVILEKEVSTPSWQGRRTQPTVNPVTSPRFQASFPATMNALGMVISKEAATYCDTNTAAKSWELSESVTLKGTVEVEKIKVANVVAKLEGSDPALRHEYIGVGAHLDHLGKRGNVVYYGADDDGSGCTALLQLAGALTKNKVKPKRSVLFMAFYGEEMGLLGSRFLSDNCPLPIGDFYAELQMDMVGRNSSGAQNGDPKRMDKEEENRDTIRLVGSKRISTELDRVIVEMNQHVGFRFKYDAEDVYTRSDHFNFARLGIPIAFFFSGFHPDYHQATDTIEKINYEKIANTTKLNYLVIHKLGEYQGRLPKDVAPPKN
jgi:hypothetical protein